MGRDDKGRFVKGHTSWIKGKTKDNCEELRKISKRMIGNKLWDNPNSKKNQFKKGNISWTKTHRHSEKTKRKISEVNKGRPSWCKGLTKETDERIKKWIIKRV